MLTYKDLVDRYLEKTKDSTTANTTLAQERINSHQRLIAAALNYNFKNRTYTFVTEASTGVYELPVNIHKIKSVIVTIGTTTHKPVEIRDVETWDAIANETSSTSDYPSYFMQYGDEIWFYPKFSTAALTVTLRFTKRPAWMGYTSNYTTGTVAVTNGSTAVTGSGTTFTTPAATLSEDGVIIIKNKPYLISLITNDTAIVLANEYQGTTATGLSYKLGDFPIIPEDFHDLLWLRPAMEYYGINKKDMVTYKILKEEAGEIEGRLQVATRKHTTRTIYNREPLEARTSNDYPQSIG